MDIDNSVKKFVQILESLVLDLDEQKKILDDYKRELESVSRFLAYTKDNLEMVGIYADQDLVIDAVEKIGYSKEEYKASCYLTKSEDESVKALPQYAKAYELISDIIEFFKLHKAELIVGINELSESCKKKELEKKYYNILSSSEPFIEDVNEFKSILNDYDMTKEDQINILIYIIKNNISSYEIRNKWGIKWEKN